MLQLSKAIKYRSSTTKSLKSQGPQGGDHSNTINTMEIQVKDSTIIRPAKKIDMQCLRLSDLDLSVPAIHMRTLYFYRRPNYSSNFFQADLLKEALSNVLVPFYPLAGRFGRNKNGRIEIQCNGEGVLFLDAETSCIIDGFESSLKLFQLVPSVDSTKDIFSYPLLLIQVTRFKCGGVCLGLKLHHTIADATSTYHFINSWAEMTRGLSISIPPFFDRTVLDVGVLNSPSINTLTQNIELQSNSESITITTAILKLSPDQIEILKEKSINKYTRLEILAAHIWRCACKARGLSDDQASKLYISTNGRSKLNPQIPSEYFGNVIIAAKSVSLSGGILSEPLNNTAERIHKAIKQIDNEYLKSALVYLKQQPDLMVVKQGVEIYKCPNLLISKLVDLPMYDANFGWGKPISVRPITASFDGMVYILPSPSNDKSWSVVINLETQHIQLFKKLFYEIFLQRQNVRCRY